MSIRVRRDRTSFRVKPWPTFKLVIFLLTLWPAKRWLFEAWKLLLPPVAFFETHPWARYVPFCVLLLSISGFVLWSLVVESKHLLGEHQRKNNCQKH